MRRQLRLNRVGHERRARFSRGIAQIDGQNSRVQLAFVKRRGQRQTRVPVQTAEHAFGGLKRRERRGKEDRAARFFRLFQNVLRRTEQKQFDPRGFLRAFRQHGVSLIQPSRRILPAGRQRKRIRSGRPRAFGQRAACRVKQPFHRRVQVFRRLFQTPGGKFFRPRRFFQRAQSRRQRLVKRVFPPKRLPRVPPKPAELFCAHRRRRVILHARSKLMRLVDKQRRAALHQRVDGDKRIEYVVVVADDHVRQLRQRQRQLKRAEPMCLRQRADLAALLISAVKRAFQRVRQAVVKPFRIGADLRAAVSFFHWADLVLGGDFNRQQLCAARLQNGQRVHRALSPRRPRRQHQHAGAFALAQRQHGRIQRGHRLADARRRLGEESFLLPNGDIHVRGEFSLPSAVSVVGKRQIAQRRIPRLPPRQQFFRPCAGGRAQRLKFGLQPRAVRVLFIQTNGRAVFIHI